MVIAKMSDIKSNYQKNGLGIETIKNLIDYQKYITFYKNHGKQEDFFVSTDNYQSSLLVTELLKSTSQKIAIIFNRNDEKIMNLGICEKEFLNCILRVDQTRILFLEKEIDKNSSLIKKIFRAQEKGKSVDLFYANDEIRNALNQRFIDNGSSPSFWTFDDNKYRIEFSSDSGLSLASFKAPTDTKKYIKIFDDLLNNRD